MGAVLDHDLLFKDDYWKDDKDYYTNRALLNCADWDENGFQYIDSEKTYTDDELLLLYALDFFFMVWRWYLCVLVCEMTPRALISLANRLKYKDRIFKLLFKKGFANILRDISKIVVYNIRHI